jgi:hypothetical protein
MLAFPVFGVGIREQQVCAPVMTISNRCLPQQLPRRHDEGHRPAVEPLVFLNQHF